MFYAPDHGYTAEFAGRKWQAEHIFDLESQLREDLAMNSDYPTIGFKEVTWSVINVQRIGSVSINGLLLKANGR